MTVRVAAICRHPVKSLQGESLDAAAIDDDGMRGDRAWGIRDDATGRILTARREPSLLLAGARLLDSGEPELTLPDGVTITGAGSKTDAALSEWIGRPVTLVAAADEPAGTGEFFADATDDTSEAIEWTMPAGRFVDALPLLLVTTSSLAAGARLHPDGAWDPRRFRPNILIETGDDGWVEDGWCGSTVRIGAVEVRPQQPCQRCTMVTRPQPGGLERDLAIFKTLARHHGSSFGVWTRVLTTGTVCLGDPVEVLAT